MLIHINRLLSLKTVLISTLTSMYKNTYLPATLSVLTYSINIYGVLIILQLQVFFKSL